MLEYDIDEAEGLLTKNRTNAIKSLEDVKDQLGKWNTLGSYYKSRLNLL